MAPVYQLGCVNLDQGMALVTGVEVALGSLNTGFAYSIVASNAPRPSSRSGAMSDVYVMQSPPQSVASPASGSPSRPSPTMLKPMPKAMQP